ncbi:MAG: hypothetical protein ACK5JT_09455 [Hyphomicrobiaceae bacterium]
MADWLQSTRVLLQVTAVLAATAAFPAFSLAEKGDASVLSPAGANLSSLTPEERAEKEARKACKVKICKAFRIHKATDGDITCSVLKSWRKEQLDTMISKAKVSWPWGPVKCTSDIKLSREMLAKATTEAKYELALAPHTVTCTVEREKKDPATISFTFSPKVTFENGKAVKAKLHWGKVEAPTVLKGAMWTATATDNTLNVLQSMIVKDVNDFIGPRCDEVKSDWQGSSN